MCADMERQQLCIRVWIKINLGCKLAEIFSCLTASRQPHVKELGDLFSLGEKITLFIKFVYREECDNAITARGLRKKKSPAEA